MAKLVHTVEGAIFREYVLTEGTLHVGRSPENEVQVDDLAVSGRHAVIKVTPSPYMEGLDDIVVEDLGSTNGTRVNGTRITRHSLKHEDLVQIGSHDLKFIDEQTLGTERTRIYLSETQA